MKVRRATRAGERSGSFLCLNYEGNTNKNPAREARRGKLGGGFLRNLTNLLYSASGSASIELLPGSRSVARSNSERCTFVSPGQALHVRNVACLKSQE